MSEMALCACGFNVEQEDVRERDPDHHPTERHCTCCRKCTEQPDLREAYRRGFNAGLDAMRAAVVRIVDSSNLRRRAEPAAPNMSDSGGEK